MSTDTDIRSSVLLGRRSEPTTAPSRAIDRESEPRQEFSECMAQTMASLSSSLVRGKRNLRAGASAGG